MYTKRLELRGTDPHALIFTKVFKAVPEGAGVIKDGDSGYPVAKETMEYYFECEKGGWLDEKAR